MKKVISILLILALIIPSLLISCAPGDVPAEETPIESETESGALQGDPVYITLDLGCENAEISANLLLAYSNVPAKLPTPTRESYVFAGWFKKGDYLMTAVYHPAYLLRDPRKKEDMLTDMKRIRQKLDEEVEG